MDVENTAVRADGTATGVLLRLDSISIGFDGRRVVHDVSLDVAEGEVVAVIGPSGAGKSTLLRSINHLEVPSSGTVHLGGRPVDDLALHRRAVGMVFQQFNLFPHLTALENVMLGQVHSLGRTAEQARERALRELADVGMSTHADVRPARCSGGQQQRIAIARALAMDPRIMLFDEATSALDPELAAEVLQTMRNLAGRGMTMLVVTHEMHFAEDVADRVAFMADGRLVELGPAEQVLRAPRHERTRRFLSAVRSR